MTKGRGYFVDDEERRSRGSYRFKNLFLSVGLVAVLIWGATFLLSSINDFRSNRLAQYEFEKLMEAGLLQSSSKPKSRKPHVLVDGKLPLNHSTIADADFNVNIKSFQWMREPESPADEGTYFEHDGEKFVIKSIVNEDYMKVLYNSSKFSFNGIEYDIDNFVPSPDLKKALFVTNSTKKFRHSSTALYWFRDLYENVTTPLLSEDGKISAAVWSPKSDHIAFSADSNVYVFDVSAKARRQITFDGSDDILNGVPDWVYEEDVFGTDITIWWSPGGEKLTFLRTDDTQTPEFDIPLYVQKENQDYPENLKLKYTKPGYKLPVVDLYVYDVSTGDSKVLDLPTQEIGEKIINEVFWLNDSIAVKATNRHSTVLEMFLVNTYNLESEIVRTVKTENEWIDISNNAVYVPKNESLGRLYDGYIDTVSYNGYRHLAYFSPPNAKVGKPLTSGNWEVANGVAAFDDKSNEVYFKGTLKSSIERHFYSVNLFGSPSSMKNITHGDSYYSGSFSPGVKYLLLNYEGPGVPNQNLLDLDKGKIVKVIEDNSKLNERLKSYAIPDPDYKVVTIQDEDTGEPIKVNAVEYLPLNFDPKRKYPVLFFGYGGPGSQIVKKTFSVSFSAAIAAELDCVVVSVDGRGTGFNAYNEVLGSQFQFIVKDNLGYYEAKDQIAAARLWASKDYVDANYIGIWGWSYGGYLTLKALEANYPNPVFSFGLSVAPVTNWRFYNAVYTERYMGTPNENPDGYNRSAVHNNIKNFAHAKKFFIGHGSSDDNVHLQNSLKLIDDFNLQDIENFEFMIFPDSDHRISYHNGFNVIFSRLTDFIRRAIDGDFD